MIELKNITKTFDNRSIFKNFNLTIEAGEFIGIVGKSGKGKTTLLNMMGMLEKPDSGVMKIRGKEVQNKRTKRYLLRDEFGFIFQNYALIDNATVDDNLEIALKHKRMKKAQKSDAISSVLKKVGLSEYGKEKVHTLSGGEQQRIAIARLLLKDPSIILADEPTGSLDRENRDSIVSLFQTLHKQGKTIVMVTHDRELTKFFSRTIEL